MNIQKLPITIYQPLAVPEVYSNEAVQKFEKIIPDFIKNWSKLYSLDNSSKINLYKDTQSFLEFIKKIKINNSTTLNEFIKKIGPIYKTILEELNNLSAKKQERFYLGIAMNTRLGEGNKLIGAHEIILTLFNPIDKFYEKLVTSKKFSQLESKITLSNIKIIELKALQIINKNKGVPLFIKESEGIEESFVKGMDIKSLLSLAFTSKFYYAVAKKELINQLNSEKIIPRDIKIQSNKNWLNIFSEDDKLNIFKLTIDKQSELYTKNIELDLDNVANLFPNLISLSLKDCKIGQEFFLKIQNLKNLQYIYLKNVATTNIDILKSCKNLKNLKIERCDQISSYDFLSECGLNSLELIIKANRNLDFLEKCGSFLKSLHLHSQISFDLPKDFNFDIFKNFSSLVDLNLSRCSRLENLDFLKSCRLLKEVNFSGCKNIENFDLLSSFELRVLHLRGCEHLNNKFISDISSLVVLDLSYNEVVDIEEIKGCNKLQTLILNRCSVIKNLDSLKSFPYLKKMQLSGYAGKIDTDLLKSLPIEELNLCEINLLNYTFLLGMSNLRKVNLKKCVKVPSGIIQKLKANKIEVIH